MKYAGNDVLMMLPLSREYPATEWVLVVRSKMHAEPHFVMFWTNNLEADFWGQGHYFNEFGNAVKAAYVYANVMTDD